MKHMKIEKSIFRSWSTRQTSRGRKWKKKEEQSLSQPPATLIEITDSQGFHTHTPHFLSENRTTSRPAKTLNISEAEMRRRRKRRRRRETGKAHLKEELIGPSPTPPQIHDKIR